MNDLIHGFPLSGVIICIIGIIYGLIFPLKAALIIISTVGLLISISACVLIKLLI